MEVIFIAPMVSIVVAYIIILKQSKHFSMPIYRKRSEGTTDRIRRSKADDISEKLLARGDVTKKEFTYNPSLRMWTFHNPK